LSSEVLETSFDFDSDNCQVIFCAERVAGLELGFESGQGVVDGVNGEVAEPVEAGFEAVCAVAGEDQVVAGVELNVALLERGILDGAGERPLAQVIVRARISITAWSAATN